MMKMSELPINQVICGDCREVMRGWPAEIINFVMFSPPYWGLRNYGENTNAVWGGDPNCEHEWEEYKATTTHENRQNLDGGTLDAKQTQQFRKELHGWQKSQAGFCSKCSAWFGQLGLEPTYQMYVEHLVGVGREIKRVLRKDGSWYLNLGDTYNSHSAKSKKVGGFQGRQMDRNEAYRNVVVIGKPPIDLPDKCKLLIPHRVALALIDDGWIVRNDCVWFKPNSMPSSAKDRMTNKFEFVFHLVKSKKYYYDLDAIREPHKTSTIKREKLPHKVGIFAQTPNGDRIESDDPFFVKLNPLGKNPGDVVGYPPHEPRHFQLRAMGIPHGGHTGKTVRHDHPLGKNPGDVVETSWKMKELVKQGIHGKKSISDRGHSGYFDKEGNLIGSPLGANPGDFWGINTRPSDDYWCPSCKDFVKQKEMKCVRCGVKVMAHFAVYSEELCIKPMKSSCPTQVCRKCGKPRERIVETHNPSKQLQDGRNLDWTNIVGQKTSNPQSSKSLHRNKGGVYYSGKFIGWSDCKCGADFEPGIVVDPMCGRGTTLAVAKKLGLRFIGIDINPDYCEMTTKWLSGVEWPLEAYA
ncbi:MAG: site-specific DNA-methyltransferase [Desulfobacterales bacterium]|nr:site-specific DNA-methyltransferase [Desulfobacterales bacterium]